MAEDTTDNAAPDSQEAGDDKESALVPSSLFGGDCSVGDVYSVKVVGKYDDQLAVEHVPDKEEEKSEDEGTMKGAMASMDSMAEPESKY